MLLGDREGNVEKTQPKQQEVIAPGGGGGSENTVSFIAHSTTVCLFKLCAHVPLIKNKNEFKECRGGTIGR